MAGLGAAPSPDDEDLYKETQCFPIAYRAEDDPEVVEHTKEAQREIDRDSEVEDGSASESDDNWEDVAEEQAGESEASKKTKKKPKVFTVIDKVSLPDALDIMHPILI